MRQVVAEHDSVLTCARTDFQQRPRCLAVLLQHGQDRPLVVFAGLGKRALGHGYFLLMYFWPMAISFW